MVGATSGTADDSIAISQTPETSRASNLLFLVDECGHFGWRLRAEAVPLAGDAHLVLMIENLERQAGEAIQLGAIAREQRPTARASNRDHRRTVAQMQGAIRRHQRRPPTLAVIVPLPPDHVLLLRV
jgi:hypothetical protein